MIGAKPSLAFEGASFAERKAISGRRLGFSLIELITAMLASTVLVASLAATVVISSQMLEVPPGGQTVWHDRTIADRLASDLRYATSVTDGVGNGFEVTKPNTSGLSQETATWELYTDGITRQVGSGPIMNLDPEAPGHQFLVDGYSAPTSVQSDIYVRLRSSSSATTSSEQEDLDVDVPPGCKTGDLVLLCVSARTSSSMDVSESGWQTLHSLGIDDLRLIVLYRVYNPSWPSTITVSSSPDSAMAAAMLAFENVEPSSPIDWTGTSGGFAWQPDPATYPTPLEASGTNNRQLNVQIVAVDRDPWIDGALGMAGFTDAVQATAAQSDVDIRNTIGIVIRNGPSPVLSSTPRLLHQSSGHWLQVAVRLEVAP